jgi:6-phosphogluconolactonase (cycloisomerase 2 family)
MLGTLTPENIARGRWILCVLLLSMAVILGGCGSGNSPAATGTGNSPAATGGSPSSSGSTGVGSGSQPQAHFLYSATFNTAEVSGFKASTSTSQLTVVPGSPFPSPTNGTSVGILAADPQLRLLLATNEGNPYFPAENITSFSVDVNSGSLTPVSTLDTTGLGVISLAVSPSGNYLYATNGLVLGCCSPVQGQIRIFSIGAAGALTQVASIDQPSGLGSTLTALTIDPTGAFLYAAAEWQSDLYHSGIMVVGYAITNGGSGLSLLATYPELDAIPSNTSASGIYVNSNYLYASSWLGQALHVFQRHADGTLVRLASPSIPLINPEGIAATPNGQFVYLADGSNARVLAFSVASSGALTQIDTFAVGPPGTNFVKDVIVGPSGNTLYVSAGGGEVFALSIAADGHLTEAVGSPYFTVNQAASNTIVLF